MTKTEARAILACQDKINKALDACIRKLEPQTRDYAEAYWATHIRLVINSIGFGSAPINRARDVLGLD